MTTTTPTPDEGRIVDSYQRVLGEVARCAQAVRDGDWARVASVADQLARRAAHLAVAAGELRAPETAPRAQVVIDGVVPVGGPAGELARSLHPQRPASAARGALANPFLHPDAQQRS